MHSALEIMRIPTAPHHEDLVAAFVRAWLQRLKIPFREDRGGNILAEYRCGRAKTPVAFSVHMDHPGFEVMAVRRDTLHCRFLGGVPPSYFKKGVPVEFFDGEGHCTGWARIAQVAHWAPGRRDIHLRRVRGEIVPGQFGMWKLPPLRFDRKSRRVVGRACDDLAGCAALLAALQALRKRRSACRFFAIFTRREEIGLCGAFEVAKSGKLSKSIPIVSIETSRAFAHAPQGAGPIVRVGDRSSIFDPGLTKHLCEVAERLKTPFQRKLMDGGTCEATAFLEADYTAGGICVALGNYHNCGRNGRIAAENIHEGDWQGLVRLIVEAAS